MSAQDFDRWQELNSAAGAERASSPCEDCTAGHAAAMRDAGRCNGTLRESAPLSDRFLTGEALERRRDQWREAQRRRRARVAA